MSGRCAFCFGSAKKVSRRGNQPGAVRLIAPERRTGRCWWLGIIVTQFRRGEFNKIRLANKAIAEFEAAVHFI